ncbi:MAG: nitrogen fixation protein NifEH [Treponema sp.]|jgi:nitrogenase iron protein|nr:nitrogen fixation protein NifEH [Treponema sp.]
MAKIALYGKGGIGKSTIAANISAALGRQGKGVLQVGCDPKHDSTRLLLGGRRITTVLEYLRNRSPDQCRPEDIVFEGLFGVHCIEAGGPEPGVGCAGRGILSTFELMERLGIGAGNYDAVIYDVLGDVVCGGFAVPIRREYADRVYIVSSGEFMSIYAANNILRGLKNYDQNRKRAGGIILNSRGLDREDEGLRRFCEAVKLPLVASFPRSQLFAQSEAAGKCLVEAYPDSETAEKFRALADLLIRPAEPYPALPLSDEELEERILGPRGGFRDRPRAAKGIAPGSIGAMPGGSDTGPEPGPAASQPAAAKPALYSKALIAREPLHGCAFSGAMSIATQLGDCVSVAHGPRSCAHITYQSITSAPRRFLLERGIVLPYVSAPPVVSSEMNEGAMIFGGIGELRKKIVDLKNQRTGISHGPGDGTSGGASGEGFPGHPPPVIFVLTTCPAGIIGDDIAGVLDLADPATRIIPLLTGGNLEGDYLQGILFAYREIARALIDRTQGAEVDTVNIVAEKPETNARAESFRYVKAILDSFGITVNCHFICETSVEEIRRFCRGRLNILAWGDYMGRAIRGFLETEFGAEFFEDPFPIGFRESCDWVRKIGACFHKPPEAAEAIVAEYTRQYRREIGRIKPNLKGKKLMVITYNQNIDWILQTALDLEMEIPFVGILNFSQDNNFKTRFKDDIGELRILYDNEKRQADLERIRPDLLLTNYGSNDQDQGIFADTIPLCPTAGFMSGLLLARRWSEFFKMNLKEGWRQDEFLFRKYLP